jgi:hypothetical protein
MTMQELMNQVIALPAEDSAMVVDSVVGTLNSPDAAADKAWIGLAQRRLNERRSHAVESIPG